MSIIPCLADLATQGSHFFYKTNGTELYVFLPFLVISSPTWMADPSQLHQGNRLSR